jgi:glycosyltransferase involved in cell wall biosynthesis
MGVAARGAAGRRPSSGLDRSTHPPHVISRLPQNIFEGILVDGGSVDDTVAVAGAQHPDVRVAEQSGRGLGSALACGFASCQADSK